MTADDGKNAEGRHWRFCTSCEATKPFEYDGEKSVCTDCGARAVTPNGGAGN